MVTGRALSLVVAMLVVAGSASAAPAAPAAKGGAPAAPGAKAAPVAATPAPAPATPPQPAPATPTAAAPAASPPAATPATPSPSSPAPAAPSPAEETPSAGAPAPRLHHAPPAVASAHASLLISANIDFSHLVRRALVVYRPLPAFGHAAPEGFSEVEFLRGSPGPYVATIPAEAVRAPGLDYCVELELVDGRRVPAFASQAEPHQVVVSEDLMDVREHAALERLGGRRSVVSTFAEYVSFGPKEGTNASGSTSVNDWYYRVEAAYTYRPLRVVDEFSIHAGVVRGHAPGVDGADSTERKVGLNYGAPSVRVRLADMVRLEGELLLSVTEIGFSGGGGAAIDIGDPYGSKLQVGFESIKVFGTRFWSQVDIKAGPKLRISPIVEATNMPHADLAYGVRLIGEAAYDVGSGFTVAVRGGYQAREATSGGPSGGLRLGWAF